MIFHLEVKVHCGVGKLKICWCFWAVAGLVAVLLSFSYLLRRQTAAVFVMDSQEPMMLGSPVGHASPGGALHQHPGSQFLPGYLMGDPNASTTPVLSRSMSAGHSHHSYMNSPVFGGFSAKSSPPSATMSPGNKFGQMIRSRVNASSSIGAKEKAGAPPVSSLIEDNNRSYLSPGLHTSSAHRTAVTDFGGRSGSSQYQDPNTPRLHHGITTPRRILPSSEQDVLGSGHHARTPPSPAQLDPFYAQGESLTSNVELDDTWVTVFGFPPTASSYILQQFSKCGVILENYPAPEEGNWMHIHFECKLQARKALSKSGKILPGNLMIGVTPCVDLNVMTRRNELDAIREPLDSVPLHQTPGISSGIPRLSNTPRSGVNSPKPCTIRPLTAAYNAASSGSKVSSDVQTPQKTSGMITKAMDYIFG